MKSEKSKIIDEIRERINKGDLSAFEDHYTPDFKLSGSEVWFLGVDELTGKFAFEHYVRIIRNDFLSFDVETEVLVEVEEGDYVMRRIIWRGRNPKVNPNMNSGTPPSVEPWIDMFILYKFRGDKICEEHSVYNNMQTELRMCDGDIERVLDKTRHMFSIGQNMREKVIRGEHCIPDPTPIIEEQQLMAKQKIIQ